eukprot:GEZU01023402.1.p1 GENE.GEZU01023402.1~~GEZU01023402.1.p1  ORF type:complete len:286 (-),score=5.56 GEZU01023402.1:16-873(-)
MASSYCDPGTQLCTPRLAPGEKCTLTFSGHDDNCRRDSYCYNGVCTAYFSKTKGQPCDASNIFSCDSGLFCDASSGTATCKSMPGKSFNCYKSFSQGGGMLPTALVCSSYSRKCPEHGSMVAYAPSMTQVSAVSSMKKNVKAMWSCVQQKCPSQFKLRLHSFDFAHLISYPNSCARVNCTKPLAAAVCDLRCLTLQSTLAQQFVSDPSHLIASASLDCERHEFAEPVCQEDDVHDDLGCGESHLSGGAIAAIVFVVMFIIGVVLVAVGAVYAVRARKMKRYASIN